MISLISNKCHTKYKTCDRVGLVSTTKSKGGFMTINYRLYRDSSNELANYVTALEDEIQRHLGELHFLAFFDAFQDDESRRVNQ